jgi:ATP-dependent DNA helicase RecG
MLPPNSSYPPFHPERRERPLALTADEFSREFPCESEYVEFKSGIGKELQDSAVAFSNADGGVILIGVADDGEILGRTLDPGSADAIYERMRYVRDLGRYSLHELSVDGRPVIVISVDRRRTGFAQTPKGVVKVRKGTQDEPLFGSELLRVIGERKTRRFELAVEHLSIESVDLELAEELCDIFDWNLNDLRERLEDHEYAIDGRLTVAGILYLTQDPAKTLGKAHIEIVRYPDDATVNYDLRLEIGGPLPVQLKTAMKRILDEVGTELVVLGIQRHDLRRLPLEVVREALANALAHRDYELSSTPVKVEIRPSSVMIRSPGGLPEPVTVENIRTANAPRNIAVIRALRRFGLAEDAGMGVGKMQDTMLEEMLDPPEFRDNGHEVAVVLPIRSAVAPTERAWIRELEQRGKLVGADRLLLVHAARGETLTNAKARKILQVERSLARDALRRLRNEGFLEQRGERGGATYHLAGSLDPPAGLLLGQEELASLVEGLAADGPIRNADVRVATGLGRWQVRDLLGSLVDEGRLVKTGGRRGTRYRLVSLSGASSPSCRSRP